MRRKEAALVLMALDASNLPLSLNIDDRRNENNVVNYPTQVQILASLLHGLLSRPPPPLRHVDTWTGDPNQQYTPEPEGPFMPDMSDLFRRAQGR